MHHAPSTAGKSEGDALSSLHRLRIRNNGIVLIIPSYSELIDSLEQYSSCLMRPVPV